MLNKRPIQANGAAPGSCQKLSYYWRSVSQRKNSETKTIVPLGEIGHYEEWLPKSQLSA